jgi:hypothetical protein
MNGQAKQLWRERLISVSAVAVVMGLSLAGWDGLSIGGLLSLAGVTSAQQIVGGDDPVPDCDCDTRNQPVQCPSADGKVCPPDVTYQNPLSAPPEQKNVGLIDTEIWPNGNPKQECQVEGCATVDKKKCFTDGGHPCSPTIGSFF